MAATPLANDDVTVKVIVVVPALPSVTDPFATVIVGRASFSTIVPVPLVVPSVAFTGLEIRRVNVSLPS